MKQTKRFTQIAAPSLTLSLIFFIYILFALGIKSFVQFSSNNSIESLDQTPNGQTKFSVLLGILTHPDKHDRRHFLRLIYGIQASPIADIDIKFVFCSLTKYDQKVLISLEILRFNDIIILNCIENMNKGKTYTYFSSLPRILPKQYDYIMKADDDVFIRLKPLSLSLKPLPRQDLYYGYVIPCDSKNPYEGYMSGMGFLLSWDIVEWIGNSEIAANEIDGPEDKVVGKWLKMGNKGKNRVSNKPSMYDYPGSNGKCSHELVPETIAVHKLKRWDQWFHVLEFFNVTKELDKSNLYNL